ncbi:hypothetical protein MLD38_021133 [Melastoma candidum]|uniref:Uncharacterized protein n=1 Tax=Melastoma candidum TaxID=119954 RepID=A0ACB9QFD9_9MYRT|nr:hypothetical protein MLD38_021133 [Melastoma candidum]
MDPETILDCAVFQLTPTRTRCDLVIFHGGKGEKLASGLFDPFITHLKYAKDEISKGGYSIALRPPPDQDDSWFTRYTLERFVRFVSTPEVLERFIRLEKEIAQIETQLHDNGLEKAIVVRQANQGSPSDAPVPKTESPNPSTKPNGDVVEEENSRIHLQHLLESRKVLLRKAQAMAYARGRAAGFEMDNIDELISFSEAFGASRLRNACIEFKTLCERKQTDVPWMEEVSAMEAFSSSEQPFPVTSGIFLMNDANASSNGSSGVTEHETASQVPNVEINVPQQPVPTAQIPMQFPWANHFPQFMYPVQQMPPYPGFPFPPMQPGVSDNPTKVSRKKEKQKAYKEETESSEETGTEVSDSDGEKESGSSVERKKKNSRRKHKKKSSRTVVIRNINYITSQKKDGEPNGGSSGSSTIEDELIDGDSLTTKVMDVVESLKNQKPKHHADGIEPRSFVESPGNDVRTGGRTNENWDAFQNLLMRDEEPELVEESHHRLATDLDAGNGRPANIEVLAKAKPKISDDSLALTDMHGADESKANSLGFDGEENVRTCLKKSDHADDVLLIATKMNGSDVTDADRGYTAENSLIKLRRTGDDFIIDKSEVTFDGDYMLPIKETFQSSSKRKDIPVDDSFMIQDRPHVYDDYNSSRDMSLINEFTSPPKAERDLAGAEDKQEVSRSLQPDDLCMILVKDMEAATVDQSWTSDYSIDATFIESDNRPSNEPSNSVDDHTDLASKMEENGKKEAVTGSDLRKGVKTRVPQRPVGSTRNEIAGKAKRPSSISRTNSQKSKLEKEEEMRKKVEEMAIQRQKRIAERTAAASGVAPLKRSPAESKTARASSITSDKTRSPSTARAANRAVRV